MGGNSGSGRMQEMRLFVYLLSVGCREARIFDCRETAVVLAVGGWPARLSH